MFCMNCGKELPNDALFCSECGKKIITGSVIEKTQKIAGVNSLTQNASSIATQALVGTVKKSISTKKIIVSITAIMAVAIFLLAIWSHYAVSGPEEVAESFVQAIAAMDINSAVECLDPKSQAEIKAVIGIYNIALTAVDAGVDMSDMLSIAPLLAIDSSECTISEIKTEYQSFNCPSNISNESQLYYDLGKIMADSAIVTIIYESDGKDDNEEFHMKKYNGEWKIDGSY